jgi:hypothetical protein
MQIHNHAYNPVDIYGTYKHKWHKLYFKQQQTTDNNGLVLKCCILHNIPVRYITNSSSCRTSGPLCRSEWVLILFHTGEIKSGQSGKPGRLVTLRVLSTSRLKSNQTYCILCETEVLTAVSVKRIVFWDDAPCNLVEIERRLTVAFCVHHRPDYEGSKHLWNVRHYYDVPWLLLIFTLSSLLIDVLLRILKSFCVKQISL